MAQRFQLPPLELCVVDEKPLILQYVSAKFDLKLTFSFSVKENVSKPARCASNLMI